MENWTAFASVAGVVSGLLLLLANATATAVTASETPALPPVGENPHRSPPNLSPGALLANVALTQGFFLSILAVAAVLARIPATALGLGHAHLTPLWLGVGVGAGVVLYAANQAGAAWAERLGIENNEELRAMLAPETRRGWAVLLLGVLPMVAAFEEFLFRAALVGALSVGFGLSPWLLAVGSSVAFAAGHGMQGTVGIVVTGALGFVLAAVFIVTGSLLVVVVAHYLVNALEFVVHEGLGIEWFR
jgi:membrane protease YdiL (CAAX protease family)